MVHCIVHDRAGAHGIGHRRGIGGGRTTRISDLLDDCPGRGAVTSPAIDVTTNVVDDHGGPVARQEECVLPPQPPACSGYYRDLAVEAHGPPS
jgi:hypothetical protein